MRSSSYFNLWSLLSVDFVACFAWGINPKVIHIFSSDPRAFCRSVRLTKSLRRKALAIAF